MEYFIFTKKSRHRSIRKAISDPNVNMLNIEHLKSILLDMATALRILPNCPCTWYLMMNLSQNDHHIRKFLKFHGQKREGDPPFNYSLHFRDEIYRYIQVMNAAEAFCKIDCERNDKMPNFNLQTTIIIFSAC